MARKDPKSAFDTDEFKALKKVWDQKLTDEGFKDIEAEEKWDEMKGMQDEGVSFQFLKQKSDQRRIIRAGAYGDEELFRLAEQWMDRGRWTTRAERWYFNEWRNGKTFTEIFAAHPVEPSVLYSRLVYILVERRTEMIDTVAGEDDPDHVMTDILSLLEPEVEA